MGRDILLLLFGGGFSVGLLTFIEFLIKHISDQRNRKEDKKDDTDKKISELKRAMQTQFDEAGKNWKANYCERNEETIRHLTSISTELKENIMLLTKTTLEIQEYEKNVGEALTGIIHDRILHNVEGFIERGGITVDEISTLKSMYYPYRKLGGNGDVETAYEKVANGEIPVITKEEALRRDILLQRKKIYGEEK